MKKVIVVMGSDSDLPVVRKAIDCLKSFGVPYEVHVYSAHRTPEEAVAFAKDFGGTSSGITATVASKQSLEHIFMNYYGCENNDK